MLVRDGDHAERPARGVHAAPPPEHRVRQRARVPGRRGGRADHDAALDERCPGLDDADASAQLGVPSGGRAFWVAAVREAFEEAGVLLARTADGRLRALRRPPDVEARFDAPPARARTPASARSSTSSPPRTSRSRVDDVHYFAHWITPEGEPKRFDTRFFLARAPEGQAYAHDDGEIIGSEWVRPPTRSSATGPATSP